ncbi:uncharacterized protein [Drosophila virilis]|uniref:Uncharacterized protein, isoform A n=2 Tax=Drosophila virilis TaxID=7244 RepID=B4LX73_DROVI|nr:uncharacterized protein LOC6630744 isoform X1 [Drosophila virilis]XP_032290585.1 uncharacterized protein LOC6630744 isoform X1 [Drosophila virilis]EDW66725.1 uncharacterized protein Dvir_GJ23474, isoform A [Drosophila virilis]
MATENNDSFSADELVAPAWLNAQFLEEVLRKHEKAPELSVLEFRITPASAKSDHYASVMFRANVSFGTQEGKLSKSLIIKTMPEQEGHKKEMLNSSNIFRTEIGMYTKALPKFEEILREAGDNTRLCVSCIYYSLEPRQVMIFEDLVPQGYSVVRNRDATIDELKLAFLKLAKWHAASFHILHEQPDYLQEFKHGLFEMPSVLKDPFFSSGMGTFIGLLEEVPELRKYVPHFKKMENDYVDRLKAIMQEYRNNRQPNGYYVLGHCDFHLRNMMFKYSKDNQSLEDVMLLDFQMSNICPITLDLIYAVYMLMSMEDRHNNYKELINYYFSEFLATLQKIGFKGELPNSVEFWRQVSQHKYYDIFLVTTFLPMMGVLKLKSFDPAELMQKEELRKKLYRFESFIEDVKCLLARFEELGYFE